MIVLCGSFPQFSLEDEGLCRGVALSSLETGGNFDVRLIRTSERYGTRLEACGHLHEDAGLSVNGLQR
jgi:hypothetical protein